MAALLVLLTGCTAGGDSFGSEASGARASSARTSASGARIQCVMPAPTVIRPLVTGGTLPEQIPAAPPAALAVMVGHGAYDSTSYSIQLVDANAQIVASIQAHTHSPITSSCGADVAGLPTAPLVSTSAGRVYYLDGDTDVRYLAADGSTGVAATLPGSSQSFAMFAVSPDDARIAVSVFDFRWRPVLARLYVQNLDGSRQVDLSDESLGYRWPAGWHDGKLLVGSGLTSQLQLLDPNTGHMLAGIGGSACRPLASLPTPAGFACTTPELAVGRIDWSGNVTLFATGDAFTGGASLSPDGTQLLAAGTGAVLKLIDSPGTGSATTSIGSTYGYPGDGGWLDDFHVVYRAAGDPAQAVIDLRSQAVVPLPANSLLEARLPGGY